MSKDRMSPSFHWLNGTQFLGALNDNIFKLLAIYFMVEVMGMPRETTTAAVFIIFVLPFLLFSHASGVIADRISRRNIIVATKVLECVIMLLGLTAVILKSDILFYIVVFLMSTQSTLFGPAKYGIVPELVSDGGLSRANSYLVGLTYLAIILGTFVATFVPDLLNNNYTILSGVCVGVAVIGLGFSILIEKTPPAGGTKKFSLMFPVEIYKTLRGISRDRYLFLAVLGSAYFLLVGAFVQQNLLFFAEDVLLWDFKKGGYLFPVAALGIGVGAFIAGKVSGRNIEFGVVPLGAIGLVITTLLLGVIGTDVRSVLVLMALLGLSAGLYIVPLQAFIQHRSPSAERGQILACSNFLSFLGVAISAVMMTVLTKVMSLSPAQCFLVISGLTAILAVWAVKILPDFFVRFLVLIVTRIFYRVRVRGIENIPVKGGALIVPNHVTWVDALVLSATTQRRIRFVMFRGIYENPIMKPLFKLMRVIPIAGTDSPRALVESLNEARKCLEEGYLVCVFAEGALTLTGNMRGFRPGFERIVKGTGCPVIPAYLGGAWGSIFSHYHGKLLGGLPSRIPYPIDVVYGEEMESDVDASDIRRQVMELSTEYWNSKHCRGRNLGRLFVRNARRSWFRRGFADTTGKSLSFGKALVGSIALRDKLSKVAKGEMVGILLPASVGGALVNFAITLDGRVPVNLNFTAARQSIESAAKQCEMKSVVTSRAFVEKMDGMYVPDGAVYLEDIMPTVTAADRIRALIKALFVPAGLLAADGKVGSNDLATVIFSSGSTGEPKGVMLTHHNIISNIEAFQAVVRFTNRDAICAILPLFHSFGFTTTLWCPALKGFLSYYHANPLDGGKIAEIVRKNRLTVLLSTPSFLLAYIRRATKEDFASLRLVVAGAEKLKKKMADKFEEKFGIRPLEGYGATELAPVISVNMPEARVGQAKQAGGKEGSVGHPLPGIATKVVNPDTGELLGENEPGLLMVKGPNVMKGYLGNEEKTSEVLQDGWYLTGDIVMQDSDGFIYIRDRLSRYSKIAGEMVPHLGVEDKINSELGVNNQAVFIASAPDDRKGEQLILFYTDEAGNKEHVLESIEKADMPNLWKPKKDNLIKIDEVPQLGSGKLDLKSLKARALEHVENKPGLIKKAVNKIKEAFHK